MAKICKPIVEYKEIITSTGIIIDDYTPPKKTMKRFIRLLKDIDDVRIEKMIDYPLHEIIVIAFLAVLGNANGWDGIEQLESPKLNGLKSF